jgi:hypothetical protein
MGARNYICIRARAIFLYFLHPLVILAVLLVLQKYLIKNERDEDSGVESPDANSRFSDEGSSNSEPENGDVAEANELPLLQDEKEGQFREAEAETNDDPDLSLDQLKNPL